MKNMKFNTSTKWVGDQVCLELGDIHKFGEILFSFNDMIYTDRHLELRQTEGTRLERRPPQASW